MGFRDDDFDKVLEEEFVFSKWVFCLGNGWCFIFFCYEKVGLLMVDYFIIVDFKV